MTIDYLQNASYLPAYNPEVHARLIDLIRDDGENSSIIHYMQGNDIHPSSLNPLAMIHCCRTGNIPLAQFSLSYKDDYPTAEVVITCINTNQIEILDLLLDYPLAIDDSEKIINAACKAGNICMVQMLYDGRMCTIQSFEPLFLSISTDNLELFKYLLFHGKYYFHLLLCFKYLYHRQTINCNK